jgi:hypothetical protein
VRSASLACDDSRFARQGKLGTLAHVIWLSSGLEATRIQHQRHPTMDEHMVRESNRRNAAVEVRTRAPPAGAHLPETVALAFTVHAATASGTTGRGEGCTGDVWRRAQATKDGDSRHLSCPAVPPRGSRRRSLARCPLGLEALRRRQFRRTRGWQRPA